MYDDYMNVSKFRLWHNWLRETGWFPIVYLASFAMAAYVVSQVIVYYVLNVREIGV